MSREPVPDLKPKKKLSISRASEASETIIRLESSADKGKLARKIESVEAGLGELSIEEVVISAMRDEDICKCAVCTIDNEDISGINNINSVNDPRMGAIDHTTICMTCTKTIQSCPGHIGLIDLYTPIINPIFMNVIVYVLRSVCNSCGKLLISEEQMYRKGINRLSGIARLKRIAEETTKGIQCTGSVEDAEKHIIKCRSNPVFSTIKSSNPNSIEYTIKSEGVSIKGYLCALLIRGIFENISFETASQLGFNNGSHPKYLIIKYLVVIPPRARPNIIQKGKTISDQLTQLYSGIIKVNQKLKNMTQSLIKTRVAIGSATPVDVISAEKDLVTKVQHLINNSDGKYRIGGMSDPLKGIVQRIQGKKAVIRRTAMGKRGDFTARSVIGPDPSLRFGQVSVPKIFAKYLTKPVTVNAFNIEELQKLLLAGKITHITPKTGLRAGKRLIASDKYVLSYGDVVERHLMNGDYVLMGRQPTLHKHSMMAYEIILCDSIRIGIHMSQTPPHNADFDGDEMWLIMPQTLESQVELETIVAFKKNIISGSKSSPVTGAVYDSLVGLYLLTRDDTVLVEVDGHEESRSINTNVDAEFFNDCYMLFTNPTSLDIYYTKCKKFSILPLSGKGLFSLILPPDLNYSNGKIVIQDGMLIKGEITSATIGTGTPNSIHHVIYRDYGDERTAEFITDAIMLGESYATVYGLTIGIADCMFSDKGKEAVQIAIRKAKAKVEEIELQEYTNDPLLESRRESRILEALDVVKSVATEVTEKELSQDNRFYIMAKSGGKGNFPGVTQIAGIVGQQLIENRRFDLILPGDRALPWFPPGDKDPRARGFCISSFFSGLQSPEVFFHATTGRVSLVDMGIKTADTGALQRRLIKATEDLTTQYDGTVRNGGGAIIQFLYGDDGFSTEKTSRIKHGFREYETLFDIGHLVRSANAEYLRSIA